jgi:hypothetical protein
MKMSPTVRRFRQTKIPLISFSKTGGWDWMSSLLRTKFVLMVFFQNFSATRDSYHETGFIPKRFLEKTLLSKREDGIPMQKAALNGKNSP